MKRDTLRYVLILAITSIAGIISIQFYWFSKAFDIRDKEFNQTVNVALRNVADQLLDYNGSVIPRINPVEQLSTNYFVVMVNDEIDANLLETFLVNEFQRRDLAVDFEYGIYDCVNEKMVFGNYINLDADPKVKAVDVELPIWEDNAYYFGVLFPTKKGAILGQMSIWIFSSLVLLIVVSFFGYALYIIFKQRKFSETQKQFINNMTHEFRTPISTIQLSSGVLQDPEIKNNGERLKTYARIIREESNKLLTQVENILQVAIIEDKKLQLKREELDVHEVIENVIAGFSPVLGDQKIEVELNAEKTKIIGDPIHFPNLIKNLIDNAIKYSKEEIGISVSTVSTEDQIKITVADEGIGIPKEFQKKIFRKFYRVPTGNVHDVKGFGLGLNYVKNITRMHKGKLELDSEEGLGSTFVLTFPLANNG